MARKHKRRAPRARSARSGLSPEAVESKAQENLSGGRYREAIAGFKELLKREPRPAWRAGLASAYAGRARELAAKGMLKEALVMWENRAGLGESIAFEPLEALLVLAHLGAEEDLADVVDVAAPRELGLGPGRRATGLVGAHALPPR